MANRRQLLGMLGAGVAGAGLGALAQSKVQKASVEPQEANPAAKGLSSRKPSLFVICHGMMAFQLPKPNTPDPYIYIHIPEVNDPAVTTGPHQHPDFSHVYQAGDAAKSSTHDKPNLVKDKAYELKFVNYKRQGSSWLPPELYNTANILLFSPDKKCKCTFPSSSTYRFCTIKLPVPEGYKGFVYAVNKGSGATKLFKGNHLKYCKAPFNGMPSYPFELGTLTTIPLVHVFRYTNFDSASFDYQNGTNWSTGVNGYKFFIYAEPANKMPLSNEHFQKLNTMLTVQTSDLDFQDVNNLVPQDSNGDGDISGEDLRALSYYALSQSQEKIVATSIPIGGNPADCISGYGS